MARELKYYTIGERVFVEKPWKNLEECREYVHGFLVFLQERDPVVCKELEAFLEERREIQSSNFQSEQDEPELIGYVDTANYIEKKYPELLPELFSHKDLASQRKQSIFDNTWSRVSAVMGLLDQLKETDTDAYHVLHDIFKSGFGPDVCSRKVVKYIREHRPDLLSVMIALAEPSASRKQGSSPSGSFDA